MKKKDSNETKDLFDSQVREIIYYIQEYDRFEEDHLKNIFTTDLKPRVLEMAVDFCLSNGIKIPENVENLLLKLKIPSIKTRPFEFYMEKTIGKSPGKIVKKVPNNADDEDDREKIKYKNLWMSKAGNKNSDLIVASITGEYISSNILQEIMHENAPKVRLHRDEDGKVNFLSKFIPNFSTLLDLLNKNKQFSFSDVDGFGKLFSANAIIGNTDLNRGNVGIRVDKNNKKHFACIDMGYGLNWDNFSSDTHLNYVEEYKKYLLTYKNIYKEEMFKDINFAIDVYNTAEQINLQKIAKVVDRSLEVLKEIYGDDFLQDKVVARFLKARIGIDEHISLTENILKENIGKNIALIKDQLISMSENVFLDRFRESFLEVYSLLQNNKVDNNAIYEINLLLESVPQSFKDKIIQHPIDDSKRNAVKIASYCEDKTLFRMLISHICDAKLESIGSVIMSGETISPPTLSILGKRRLDSPDSEQEKKGNRR
jgi:hypothetical protein